MTLKMNENANSRRDVTLKTYRTALTLHAVTLKMS